MQLQPCARNRNVHVSNRFLAYDIKAARLEVKTNDFFLSWELKSIVLSSKLSCILTNCKESIVSYLYILTAILLSCVCRRKFGWVTFIANLFLYTLFLLSMTILVFKMKQICGAADGGSHNATEQVSCNTNILILAVSIAINSMFPNQILWQASTIHVCTHSMEQAISLDVSI